jgi:hypothetical protein
MLKSEDPDCARLWTPVADRYLWVNPLGEEQAAAGRFRQILHFVAGFSAGFSPGHNFESVA